MGTVEWIGQTRTALVVDGCLQDFSLDCGFGDEIGDVVLGRVAKVMNGLEAAFVEIGADRAGFLGLREVKLHEGEAALFR